MPLRKGAEGLTLIGELFDFVALSCDSYRIVIVSSRAVVLVVVILSCHAVVSTLPVGHSVFLLALSLSLSRSLSLSLSLSLSRVHRARHNSRLFLCTVESVHCSFGSSHFVAEGNIVMLMEPAYPPALEQQAIARIGEILCPP